ncbi:MAG: Rieske 2Fe-2S domain-containing protein [Actinomycetota bacterium]|nr:Rieske 2Fe-2S domain-containing protein [Actinomycetota bacterium]
MTTYPTFQPAVDAIEGIQALDGPAQEVQDAVKRVVPDDSPTKDLLSGTWLGHPLHAVLTDVVIGAWTSAAFLDMIPTKGARKSADKLIGIGVLAALPTAATGLSDWSDLGGKPRRIGFVHGLGNALAVYLQARSYMSRKRGRRFRGWLRSVSAMGIATGTAYLGGHLAYSKGVGVNQATFDDVPEDFVSVTDLESLADGKLTRVEANSAGVMLYRKGREVYALSDRCPHRGCSLSDGEVGDGSVTCGCHGSTFRFEDGLIERGPATSPAPSYEVRVQGGKVQVRLPGPR